MTIKAPTTPKTPSAKGSRQQPPDFFDTGFETGWDGVTLELGCGGIGADGLSGAAAGLEGIFREISSTLLEGFTRAGMESDGPDDGVLIFREISSTLLDGRTRAEDAGLDDGVLIFREISSTLLDGLTRVEVVGLDAELLTFLETSSALLTRFRPVLSFIAISLSFFFYCPSAT
ncbi:MAG: hypothetical protein II969_01885 [Anaerolineaceae bacterium]|nr:hypothetical protein [Anaerolineaceae bacterium]